MASTYSPNLAITLLGTGDGAGTWGNTTNTNLGTIIEEAISGYVTQAVATGTDTTITIPNNTSGVARNMYLELTGTGGASTNLIVPANKKLYFIFNNTSSGQVTVKVSGQTGISVPNGKKMILVSNGTDIVTAENYVASLSSDNLTLTGTLAVGSTSTFTGAATFTANPTLSGGTANGVLYLNGSKVATSGSALTFDGANLGLGVTPSAWASSKAIQFGLYSSLFGLTSASRTVVGQNVYFDGSFRYIASAISAGWYQQSGNEHSWSISTDVSPTAGNPVTSSMAMVLTSAGNLGIGTTGSSTVRTSIRGSTADTSANAILIENSSALQLFRVRNDGFIEAGIGGPLAVTSSGNVGIGTASPGSKLDVDGTINGRGLQASGTASLLFSANKWMVQNEGTSIMRSYACGADTSTYGRWQHYTAKSNGGATLVFEADGSGNLGLGVTPSAWGSGYRAFQTNYLNFASGTAGQGDGSITWNAYNNGTNWIYQYTGGVSTRYRQNESGHAWFIAPSGTAGNAITGANAYVQTMTLDVSGRLGVGVTSPAAKVDVNGRIRATPNTSDLNYLAEFYANYDSSHPFQIDVKNNGTTYEALGVYANGGGGNERVCIPSINLGVGTTAPLNRLHVHGAGQQFARVGSSTNANYRGFVIGGNDSDGNAYGQLVMELSGGQLQLVAGASGFGGFLTIHTNGAERGRFTTGGDLLVGTSTTTTGVSGSETSVVARGKDTTNTSASFVTVTNNGAGSGFLGTSGTTGHTYVYSKSNHALLFGTNNTERGRFIEGGYLKVSNDGTYNNVNNGYHELRSNASDATVIISNSSTGASVINTYSQLPAGANAAALHFAGVIAGSGVQFQVDADGDVKNTNNSYGAISDIKLKQDIIDAASQWDDIKALRVRKFRLKTDPTAPLMIGLIAQEAELVSPGLVEESPDYEEVEVTDEEGNVTTERQPTGTSTKSVKYSILYMKAIKALQEAMARIESLEAKVSALEAK